MAGVSDWVGSNQLLIASGGGGGGGGGDQMPDPTNVVATNVAGPPQTVNVTWDYTSNPPAGTNPTFHIQGVQLDGEGNQISALHDLNSGTTEHSWGSGLSASLFGGILQNGNIVQFFVQARDESG